MKVGLIICMQTEDVCSATTDLKVMRDASNVSFIKFNNVEL